MTRHDFLAGTAGCLLGFGTLVAAETKILFHQQSPYSLVEVIEEADGLRTLQFDRNGVRQSVVKVGDPSHLELPYARSMTIGLGFCPKPKRIAVVGLGGGSIPVFLHKHHPDAQIDAVDIDPVVVKVASGYFDFRPDERMRAYVGDGRRFIEKTRDPYDIVFLDAFGTDNVPEHLTTREFLHAVRRALTRDGIVVGNIWSRNSNPLYDAMVRTYQEVFESLYIFDVPGAGNRILVALPRSLEIGRDELARRVRAVGKEARYRFDPGELVIHGYQYADRKDSKAEILKDKVKR